jgi:hypothetical protein
VITDDSVGSVGEREEEEQEEAMCYICWGGVEPDDQPDGEEDEATTVAPDGKSLTAQ